MSKKIKKIFNLFHPFIFLVILSAFVIYGVVLAVYFINFYGELSSANGDWGTFGDFIGGTLNPLFSLFGFIALLFTIGQQQRTLKEQEQLRVIERFEPIFFKLVDSFEDSLNELYKDKAHYITKLFINDKKKLTDEHLSIFSDEENIESYKTADVFWTRLKDLYNNKDNEYFYNNTAMLLEHILIFLNEKTFSTDKDEDKVYKRNFVKFFLKDIKTDFFLSLSIIEHATESEYEKNSSYIKALIDLDLVKYVKYFSPYSKNEIYATHPVTKKLVEVYGREAFVE